VPIKRRQASQRTNQRRHQQPAQLQLQRQENFKSQQNIVQTEYFPKMDVRTGTFVALRAVELAEALGVVEGMEVRQSAAMEVLPEIVKIAKTRRA
jgi:hypothetical protein